MITIPAVLENVSTRKDKTLKLTFGSNELSPNQAAELLTSADKYGYLAFKIESFQKSELENIEGLKSEIDFGLKTPSQRLRGVLFKLYESDSEDFKTFAKYYDHKMEQLINHFKTKLD